MISRMLTRIAQKFSKNQAALKQKKNQQILKKMSENIEKMKLTMDKTTPRMFALLFILSTVPSFYYINQLLQNDYKSDQYKQNSENALKYFYLKNTVFFTASLVLFQMNFRNPSSKFVYQSRNIRWRYVPLALGFLGMFLPPTDTKHIVWPAITTDLFTTVIELQITTCGATPFWFYSFRHFIRFLDYATFAIIYFSLKRYKNRRETHPHQFVKQIIESQVPLSQISQPSIPQVLISNGQ